MLRFPCNRMKEGLYWATPGNRPMVSAQMLSLTTVNVSLRNQVRRD